MKHKFSHFILAFFLIITFKILAIEHFESPNLMSVQEKAFQLSKNYGRENVLIVYDLDNTLLTQDHDLGSYAWALWQINKIKSGDFTNAVAANLKDFYEIHAKLFSLGRMHTIEKEGASIFNGLQKKGFTTLILTARLTENKYDTQRALQLNNFDTSIKPLQFKVDLTMDGVMVPKPAFDIKLFDLKPFKDGVYYASMSNKGEVLKKLLKYATHKFKAVIFVDDSTSNLADIRDIFSAPGTEIFVDMVTVRYSRMDDDVKRFEGSDKRSVIASWNLLSNTLLTVFPEYN